MDNVDAQSAFDHGLLIIAYHFNIFRKTLFKTIAYDKIDLRRVLFVKRAKSNNWISYWRYLMNLLFNRVSIEHDIDIMQHLFIKTLIRHQNQSTGIAKAFKRLNFLVNKKFIFFARKSSADVFLSLLGKTCCITYMQHYAA